MITYIQKLILTALLLLTAPIESFVGFYLIKTPQGKWVLILGDMHSGGNQAADIIQADQLMNHLEQAQTAESIELVVELDPRALQSISQKGPIAFAPAVERILNRSLQGNGPIKLTLVEERTRESDLLPELTSLVGKLVSHFVSPQEIFAHYGLPPVPFDQMKPFSTKESFIDHIKKIKLNPTYSLKTFFAYLEKNRARLSAFQEIYAHDEAILALLQASLNRYDQAVKNIKELFKAVPDKTDFAQAFVSLFYECTTPTKIIKRFSECYKNLLIDTDYLFADSTFMNTLFQILSTSKSELTVLVVGQAHAKSIANALESLHYTITRSSCSVQTYDSLASLLLIDPKVFHKKLLLTIREFLSFGAKTPDARRCDLCNDAAAQLKTCSACKKAQYCSKACQKKAWPLHKKECVKQKVHVPG